MTRRPFALLLFLLAVVATPARAMPITGYAIGQVTENRSFFSPGGGPRPYEFTVGEAVYVRFTYDLDPPAPLFPGWKSVMFDLATGSGFSRQTPLATFTRAEVAGESLYLVASQDPWTVDLRFVGDVGRIDYSRDLGAPTEGFLATLTRVADDSAFPTPEPSTLSMGLVGVGMLGVAVMRRRRVAT